MGFGVSPSSPFFSVELRCMGSPQKCRAAELLTEVCQGPVAAGTTQAPPMLSVKAVPLGQGTKSQPPWDFCSLLESLPTAAAVSVRHATVPRDRIRAGPCHPQPSTAGGGPEAKPTSLSQEQSFACAKQRCILDKH